MAISDLIPWNNRSREMTTQRGNDVHPVLALHREIDNDHIRVMAAVHPVSGCDVSGIKNRIDAGVFENAPASLVYDRMIVDDQSTGHGTISPSRG